MPWYQTLIELAARALELLTQIPGTFWGVMVGSFFTLAGIARTNKAQDERQRKQFAHEQELKAADREHTLRKEVFLAASEEMNAGFQSLMRFANLEIPIDKISELQAAKVGAIGKVHIVAKQETVNAIVAFGAEMATAHFRLMAKRAPLQLRKSDISRLQRRIDGGRKSLEKNYGRLRQRLQDGVVDERAMQLAKVMFETERTSLEADSTKFAELGRQLNLDALSLLEECVAEMRLVGSKLTPAVLAMRQDLDVPLDGEAYKQLIAENSRKQKAAIEEFVLFARKSITERT